MIKPDPRLAGGVIAVVTGIGIGLGHLPVGSLQAEWAAMAAVLLAVAGTVAALSCLSYPRFDADLDKRLRSRADARTSDTLPLLSSHLLRGPVDPRDILHVRRRLWDQCAVRADTSGLSVTTVDGTHHHRWSAITRVAGVINQPPSLGGLGLTLSAADEHDSWCLRPHGSWPEAQVMSLVPPAVRTAVRYWRYNRPLRAARGLLLVVTAIWVLAFTIDIAAGGLAWDSLLTAPAAAVAIWAFWAAMHLPRFTAGALESVGLLAVVGTLPAFAMAVYRSNTMLGLWVGWSLLAGTVAVVVALVWAYCAMPSLRRPGDGPALRKLSPGAH